MAEVKPYTISKQVVWEAYLKVKANKGAAGVDGQSIEAFETDLKNNLYKIWNRMSSGSYFPPPVRLVEIPKATGGLRPLGIPTVADRVAQMVVMTTHTGIVPASRPWTRWRRPGSGAGVRTGSSIWTSKVSLTIWITTWS
jgi:RNA-directed DNA polymerase